MSEPARSIDGQPAHQRGLNVPWNAAGKGTRVGLAGQDGARSSSQVFPGTAAPPCSASHSATQKLN